MKTQEQKLAVSKTYYFEWGNEPAGFVTTYTIVNGEVIIGSTVTRQEAYMSGYIFDCPFP